MMTFLKHSTFFLVANRYQIFGNVLGSLNVIFYGKAPEIKDTVYLRKIIIQTFGKLSSQEGFRRWLY